MESSPDQKSWFKSHTVVIVVIWPINNGPLIRNFCFADLHNIIFMSKSKQSERYFCYNHLFIKFRYLAYILHLLPQKNVLFVQCLYLAGLSNQIGAFTTLVLNGVRSILHRELEACGLNLPPCAAFVSSSLNCEYLDQLITLIRS